MALSEGVTQLGSESLLLRDPEQGASLSLSFRGCKMGIVSVGLPH